MAPDVESDLKLEIAHILTIDVVAYSTLLIHEQSRVMAELNKSVRTLGQHCGVRPIIPRPITNADFLVRSGRGRTITPSA